MKGVRILINLTVLILLGITSCAPQPATKPILQTGVEPVLASPVIRSVQVLQSDTPKQILLVVQAALSNSCLQLGEATVDRQGQVFHVTLPETQVGGQGCQAGSVNQAQVIPLTNDTLLPGNYIVLVNGMVNSFNVPAPARSNLVSSHPTVVAAAVAPTATPDAVPDLNPSATPDAAPGLNPSATPVASSPAGEAPLPVPTATATNMALATGKDPANCVNKAAFYGVLTIPDGTPFEPGTKFSKTWLVMNAGTCTWGADYRLVFAGGDPLGAPQSIPLPKASPRQVVQVTVDMTAPIAPLNYESDWAFESPDGYIFGLGNPATIPLTAKINVVPRPVGLPSGLDCGALRLKDMEAQVLDQINTTRAQYGLYPLKLVEDISQVALKHSLEMACYNRESHYGLDGNLYNVRLQRDGILFETSNEIIYSGNGGPAGSILWWMNSPIHRPIVLSNKYTEIGIGFVYYDRNPYKQRITVDFIHP